MKLTAVAGLAAVGASLAVGTGSAAAVTGPIRVGTAGTAVIDSAGAVWGARAGFVGGRPSTVAPAGTPIRFTTSPQLYRAGLFGMSGFAKPVTNGAYTVTVKMAENYFRAAGQRVFDVTAEGRTVLAGIDVFRSVGFETAYDRSFPVTVTDGTLNLGFAAKVNNALVMAISVTPAGASNPASTPAVVTRPGPANTGVPAGTTLTRHVGDLVVSTPGAVISNLDIYGYVTIKAPNVTIRNSRVHGGAMPPARSEWGLVTDVDAHGTNFLIENSEIFPDHPSMWIDGIKGWNYTADHVNIHGTVDTAKVFGDNATIRNSWLHDTVYYTNDPVDAGGHTHNDGVQVLSGHNIHILGNTITGSNNAAMQVTQNHGVVGGLFFQGNYADGGGCSINLSTYPLPTMSGITVTGNRFGRNTRIRPCPILSGPGTRLTTLGNVWDDNGLPALVVRGK